MASQLLTEKRILIMQQIEEIVASKHLSYLDAILLWKETNDVELEEIASLIKKDPELKLKLQTESEKVHLLK